MSDIPDSQSFSDEQVISLDFSNWPLPDDYAVEVGRLMSLWSSLETMLDNFIGKLAGYDEFADPTVLIFTLHSSFPQKLNMFESLCDLLAPEYPSLSKYKDVTQTVRKAQTSRNRFAHNGMIRNEETGKITMSTATARGKLKVGVEEVSLAEIKRATMQTHEAMISLHNLVLQKNYEPKWRRS